MSGATVTSSSARPGGSRWVPAALLPLVALLAGGCGAPEERDPVEIDCSAVDEYEIQEPMIMDFENVDQAGWWFQFGDGSTGAFPPPENAPEPESEEIEDGGRCGSQRALVLTAYGNNFWGSGYGTWRFRTTPLDGTGTDGLALWARSPGATDKGVFLLIGERRTTAPDCGDGERGENEALVNNNDPECIRPDGYPLVEDERPDRCFTEECDDGNTVPGDGCSPGCNVEECGNGTLDPGEGCDQGSVCFGGDEPEGTECTPSHPCPNGGTCTMAAHICEGGDDPPGTLCHRDTDCDGECSGRIPSDTCTDDCRLPNCGDGTRDFDELCDDGNTRSGDGCNALCSSEEYCGNGYLDPGEDCDNVSAQFRCVECVSISCETPTREPGDTVIVYRQDAEGNIVLASGAEIERDECGNPFRRRLLTSSDWQLYILPWDSFYQEPQNNRLPDGIDPSVILEFTVVAPRESNLELWLDDFAFYRNR